MSETITITKNDDGTFTVTEGEDEASPGDQPVNQTVDSVDQVLQLVQQALGDDQGEEGSPDEAWNQEAAQRGEDGMRKSPIQTL